MIHAGNMLSAPAAQIQTVAASAWLKKTPRNELQPNYSQVMAIVMSIVFAAVAVLTACGQERLGSHFELAKRAGAEENIINEKTAVGNDDDGHCAGGTGLKKGACVHKEDV